MAIFKLILLIFGMSAGVLVLFIFIRTIVRRNQRGIKENSATLMYETIGGGRFDGYNMTYPFVRLSIYSDFIVIKHNQEIVIKFNEIEAVIELNKFSAGIQITHNNKDAPKNIIIWTSAGNHLRSIILGKNKPNSIVGE